MVEVDTHVELFHKKADMELHPQMHKVTVHIASTQIALLLKKWYLALRVLHPNTAKLVGRSGYLKTYRKTTLFLFL